MTDLRNRPILTAVLFGMVGSFPLFLAGGYAVRLQADLDISKSQFGWAVSAYFATSAVASIWVGRVIDQRGARLGFLGASLGGASAAVLLGFTNSWAMLLVALGLTGLANTCGQLGGNRLLSSVGPDRQGLAFGAKQSSVPFGSLVAGASIALFGAGVDWHTAFFGYAVFALVLATIAPADPGDRSTSTRRERLGPDRPFLIALSVAAALGGGTGNALAVLVVDSFNTAGYREAVAAVALTVGSAAAIVARTFIGWFVGKRQTDGFLELGLILGIGAAGFAVLSLAGSSSLLLWIGVVMAFSAGWGWPGVIYYAVVKRTASAPGAASAVVVAGAFLGAIGGAPLLATIAERASYQTAWTVASLLAVVGVFAVYLAKRLAAPPELAIEHASRDIA